MHVCELPSTSRVVGAYMSGPQAVVLRWVLPVGCACHCFLLFLFTDLLLSFSSCIARASVLCQFLRRSVVLEGTLNRQQEEKRHCEGKRCTLCQTKTASIQVGML